MKSENLIIGGGIVGLMTAFFLNKKGRQVTLIDQGDLKDKISASFGNAGLISSFEKTPLACPGVISHTLKLMLLGKSPVKIHFQSNPILFKWLWKFIKSTSKERLKKSLALFEKYGEISVKHYNEISNLINTGFHHQGLLMVYSEKGSFKSKCDESHDKEKYEILSFSETKNFLPFINDNIVGSVLLKRNGWLNPEKTVYGIYKYLSNNGVNFITNERVIGLNVDNSRIKFVETKHNKYFADNFILSTGADITILNKLNKKLLMLPAKGYSLTFKMNIDIKPKIASLFSDIFIALTPRDDDIRLTSIMEIGNNSPSYLRKREEEILKRFKKYSTDFEMKNVKKWTGFRPLTPNDMPLIGRDETFFNLIYATGLGWMGMTFGPAVGEIISDLIITGKENKDSDDILLLSGFYQAGC
jgi:D-amino-acid dehydrogenase